MNTTDSNLEFDEGVSELSLSPSKFKSRMKQIFNSNLEQTIKLISECSLASKEYQVQLIGLQQLNNNIQKENIELKTKLQSLEQHFNETINEDSTKNNEINETHSKVSTLWPSDSFLDSEFSYEIDTHNLTQVPQRTFAERRRSVQCFPKPKKTVIGTALIKSMSFLHF